MRNKDEEVNFILTLPHESVVIETIFGQEAIVSYALRMYYGSTKVTSRIKSVDDLVEIKAYGLVVVRSLEFDKAIPENTAKKLKFQGYRVVDEFNMAVLNKDFGFMTAQNYELNYLIHNLIRADVVKDWETMCQVIRAESRTWGEPVVDVAGRLVYHDELQDGLRTVVRNPFAKAGRLALKKKLHAQRNPLSTIKNFFTDIGGKNDGTGVDM